MSFSVNTSLAKHIDIEFYADCEQRGIFNKTNICYDVQSKEINFKIQITLTEKTASDKVSIFSYDIK